eukprot:1676596-Pyramimonas_sp.AAC.1
MEDPGDLGMGALPGAGRDPSNGDVHYEEMHPPQVPSLQQQLSRDEVWCSIDLAGSDFPNQLTDFIQQSLAFQVAQLSALHLGRLYGDWISVFGSFYIQMLDSVPNTASSYTGRAVAR